MLPVMAFLAATASAAPAVPDNCQRELLPISQEETPGGRAVTPRDLSRLRDFGSPYWRDTAQPPFRVSPDGRFAAMVLRRANPDTDSYCFGVVVIALDGSQPLRLVDHGGEPILETGDVRGLANVPLGTVFAETPLWSADGRWLAYLRRDDGQTRLWLAAADGSGAKRVAEVADDARISGWSDDGTAIVIRARPGIAAADAAIAREARAGFLFDARFWPLSSSRPYPSANLPFAEQSIPIGAAGERPAASRTSESGTGSDIPAGAIRSGGGALAWVAAEDPAIIIAPRPLHVKRGANTLICRSALCRDGVDAWWWRGDDTLAFVRHGTADNGGVSILALWNVVTEAEPLPVLTTGDVLEGCVADGDGALCTRETARHPRTLVRIAADGAIQTLFDPNPEFAGLEKGDVRRLTWQLRGGVRAYGDLVLPPDRKPGEQRPLIVVQYRSRGFLRGGTGDEYPIFALAARGFAVLSIERPQHIATGKERSISAFLARGIRGFAERRRLLASIEAGVAAAVETGTIDRSRLGITGLSDGAHSTQFALLHSRLFSAAAISSCCDEPSGQFVADHGYAEQLRQSGYPPSTPGHGRAFWRGMSLAANAHRVRTPLLMQLTDDEFRLGLESYSALERKRAPVEMYVFADGYHLKYRPAHRLAVYTRALDWFDFWLRGGMDSDPAKAEQYLRWRALAARRPR